MKLKRLIGVKLLAKKNTDKIIDDVQHSSKHSLIYKVGSQFLIDYRYPLHIYFELSRRCNYNCPMCMRPASGPGGHFPIELARKITRESAQYGPTSYSLHLFGEPLANPHWDDVVKEIRQAHRNNAVLLTTNGFFLTERNCKKLIDLKVDRVFVSLHTLDPARYERNTGGGKLSTVLDNITNFAQLIKANQETRLFVRLFKEPGDMDFPEADLRRFRELDVAVEIRGYHNFAGGQNEWTTLTTSDIERWPCFHPWFTLGVAVDGTYTVCCADYSLSLSIGNAFQQTVSEAWRSDALKSIRAEHRDRKFVRWNACKKCDTWQFHPDIFFKKQYEKMQK